MKENLRNLEIYRVYSCLECKYKFDIVQKASEDFLRICPECGKEELVIDSGTLSNSSFVMDSKSSKTVGMLMEKNTERIEKEEGEVPGKKKITPWWRKGKKKIHYSILKNPQKYVEKGTT